MDRKWALYKHTSAESGKTNMNHNIRSNRKGAATASRHTRHNPWYNRRKSTSRFATPILILCLILTLCLAGCGKKAPVQPIELPTAEASVQTAAGTGQDSLTAQNSSAESSISVAAEALLTGAIEEMGNLEDSSSGFSVQQPSSSQEVTSDYSQTQQAPESQNETQSDSYTQQAEPPAQQSEASPAQPEPQLDEGGTYTTKEDVALYIHTYGKLPSNFITKKQAQKLGWSGGSLEEYAPGKCIGGDYFGNYEGLLPTGKEYHECDIDTLGRKKRGAKRIIYSDDGYIYYTGDHYESFELLYEP